MKLKGVAAQQEWQSGKCPFCYQTLGKVEILRRKVKRICKCKSCGRIIDERFIVR